MLYIYDVIHYILELKQYKKEDLRNFKDFVDTMKWFKKHNIIINDEQYGIDNNRKSLQGAAKLHDFWQKQTEKYKHLYSVAYHLTRCKPTNPSKHINVTNDQLIEYIGNLYRVENDPFFGFLWSKLGNSKDGTKEKEIREYIHNRWMLDHESLLIENHDILMPLLYSNNCLDSKASEMRERILTGEQQVNDEIIHLIISDIR